MKKLVFFFVLSFSSMILASPTSQQTVKKETTQALSLPASSSAYKHPYAVFETSMGTIVVKLYEREVPKTVANFIGLATGTKKWKDPKTGTWVKRPFYDGLIFHRIIDNFMVQGGCPLGTGTGDPGYKFADEPHAELKHNSAGILSMANSGSNTNGSQFFITHRATPWLDFRKVKMKLCTNTTRPIRCMNDLHCQMIQQRYAKFFKGSGSKCVGSQESYRGHTVFGKVVSGLSIVFAMGKVSKGKNDKPDTDIVLKKLTIQRATHWKSEPTSSK